MGCKKALWVYSLHRRAKQTLAAPFLSPHVSYQHFVDQFKRQVGTTPKIMQRILGFAGVFKRVKGSQPVDWAALSLELGFSDQAHFVREFVAFSGYRPAEFRAQGHDLVNFYPDDSGSPKD